MFFIYVEGPGGHFDMGKQGESKLFYSLKSFIPVTYRICVLTKSKMCCGGPTGFVLYFQPQQFQPIPIVNYTHTHTHSHSLSLSLSHTHTYIYMYVCTYCITVCLDQVVTQLERCTLAASITQTCSKRMTESTMIPTIPTD
jgi:hypothetical protein